MASFDINLILLQYPHHTSYLESEPVSWPGEVRAALQRARGAGDGEQIPFWDLLRVPNLVDGGDFRNGDHLNDFGARKLARLLEARLSSLPW